MTQEKNSSLIRLNKYLSHCGLGNRRECEAFIKNGLVRVNDKNVYDAGTKVNITDKVEYKEQIVNPHKAVYILINKPKDFVFDSENKEELSLRFLIRKYAEKLNLGYEQKLFPIIDLKKNDSGLVLISNDTELLEIYNTENSYKTVVYTLQLQKAMQEIHIQTLTKINNIYILNDTKDNISVELKLKYINDLNKMFEQLGYKILKKDSVIFDFFTKRDLPRGKWRFLKPSEIVKLKHLKH